MVHRAKTSGNEWQRVTTNDSKWYNEWRRVVQRVTTSDCEWEKMTTNEKEWQQMTMSDNKWQWVTKSDSKWYNEWKQQGHFREWMIAILYVTKTDILLQGTDGCN